MLTIPEITEDEIKGIESQVLGILRVAKGTLVSFERWGKYRNHGEVCITYSFAVVEL